MLSVSTQLWEGAFMDKKVLLGFVVTVAVVFIAGCQTCPDKAEAAQALPKGHCGYGPNVRLTYSLFYGQTIEFLFAPDTPAKDVIAGWKANADKMGGAVGFPPGFIQSLKQRANELHQSAAGLNATVTYRSLFTGGAAALPQPVVAKLKALEQLGADLPFLNPVDPVEFDAIVQDLLDMNFGKMDLYALYHTPADPAVFTDVQIEAIANAIEKKVLRAGQVDFACADVTAKAANMCCHKTTRVCVAYPGRSCSMCGLYCCLASNWCP